MVDVVVQSPNDPKSRVYKSNLTQAQVDALALDFTVYTVTAGVVASTGVGPTRALAVAKPDLRGAEGNYDFINYPGSPVGNVTPARVGQRCQDTTTGLFYLAQTLSVSGWALSTAGLSLSTTNSSAAATANVSAIQSALNAGGLVQITQPGTYYINSTLVIYSNTRLVLSPGVTLKLNGGTMKNMLVTSAYQQTQTAYTSASLTWTAGRSVTVTETAHGRAIGSYVFVYSTTLSPSQFIGVFPVISITDANNYVIKLHRTPTTSPTGTVQLVTANQNVIVEGGAWDADYATNTGGTNLGQMLMVMGAVAHVRVRDVTLKNAAKYTLEFGGCYDYGADGIAADTSQSDVIKVYGPAVAGFARNITGNTADDTLSLQGKEAAAFIVYAWTWGDIINFTGDNIVANNTVNNVCTVYGSPNEYTGGVIFRNIGGIAAANGVAVVAGYNSSVVDDVTVDNSQASGAYGLRLSNNGGFTGNVINRLDVRGMKLMPDTYASGRNGFLLDANWTANEISFYGLDVNDASGLASGTYFGVTSGTIGTLNLFGGRFSGASNTSRGFQLGAVSNINCIGMSVGANCNVLFDLGGGTPTVNITGCDLNNFGAVVGTTVACQVILTGNRINVGSNGVVRSNSAVAIKVKSGGNNYVAGSLFTNGSATGLWEFYGNDISIDVGATGVQKTITGQYAFNNGSGRGTIAQNRLVTCNGTNWVQVDNTANTF